MILAASFGIVALTIGLVSVAVLLIGLVLLQKNRGAGLSGAFGGVGGHTAFGTKTGDFLTWVTVGLTALFLILAIAGNYVFDTSKTAVAAQQAPPGPAAPGSTPPMPESSLPIQATKSIPIGGAQVPAGAQPPASGQPIPIKLNPTPTSQPS
ncbi:MAG TPA: preprotein translocase subunit SecG [Phycisphaerae bacterium]|nr:preprotein translocase subunit SecG [Phycisphaerae bacterium]